jgi:hypothetical protein
MNLYTDAKVQERQHDMHNLVAYLSLVICFLDIVFTCDDKWIQHTHINKGNNFFFFYIISHKLGITNPTPLTKNLVLEICKKRGASSWV